jgi:hypothetical protein
VVVASRRQGRRIDALTVEGERDGA